MKKTLLFLVAASMLIVLPACGSDDSGSSQQSSSTESPPTATPKPISRQEQKREFLATVDESISGSMIADSPYKYVGKHVDLHCSVVSVIDRQDFNIDCGYNDAGVDIAVETDDASSLSAGQDIRVIGTVVEPTEGTNANGGDMNFPTVKAEFME